MGDDVLEIKCYDCNDGCDSLFWIDAIEEELLSLGILMDFMRYV